VRENGAFGRMRIDKKTETTQRKSTPMPLVPPYISLELTWD
jgi:hypothetical protein